MSPWSKNSIGKVQEVIFITFLTLIHYVSFIIPDLKIKLSFCWPKFFVSPFNDNIYKKKTLNYYLMSICHPESSSVIQKHLWPVAQGLVRFFCKGSDSKYLRLWRPYNFCYNYSGCKWKQLYIIKNTRLWLCSNKTEFIRINYGLDLVCGLTLL